MLLTGLPLYPFRATVGRHMRFLLPIPPLGVAAYVFVFNVFKFLLIVLTNPLKRSL